MFRPLPMQRVALQVLNEDAALAAQCLAEQGAFNPETAQLWAQQLPEFPGASYRELYYSARARLDKILQHCSLGREWAPPEPRPVSERELAELDRWLHDVWTLCSRCQEGLRRIEEQKKHIDQLLKTLDNFAALDIDLGLLASSKRFLDVHIGMVPAENVSRLRQAVSLAGYTLTPFLHHEGMEHVVVAGLRGRETEIRHVLLAAGWHSATIPPELHDRPEKVRRELERRAEEAAGETDAQCQLIETTQKEFIDKLMAAARTLALVAPYVELGDALRGRGGLALISGWAPRKDLPRLRARLRTCIGGRFVLTARDPLPEERERVPSLIRHPRWLMPFAELVRNYGIARYGEFDPTWLFALTFVAMFGMMFGDIGQGAVIVAAAWLMRRRLGKFTPFIVAAGLSSTVFGALYGSFFGFEHVIPALWMSPLTDPVRMLTLAFYWGAGFILVATLLTVYNRITEGRYGEALFGGKGVAGILFYLGLLYGGRRWIDTGAFGAVEAACIAIPLALILGYQWHHYRAPLAERILVVFIEGFETLISYFSNTLSFLRVAAFSLNHVALAIAIFALAEMMQTTGHWITIVLGNVFILVLEGAIVAIQALRLEYYEGFSRFFGGDGREFRPLRLTVSGFKSQVSS